MRSRRAKSGIFSKLGREFGDIMNKYNRRNGPLLAKGLGFSFLFGLLPLLFLAVSVAAYSYRFRPNVQSFIAENFLDFLPPDAQGFFFSHLTKAAGNWGAIGIAGIILLLTVSIALFDSLERAFATMLSAPRRKFHTGRLISLALMVSGVLLFFVAVSFSTIASYFRHSFKLSPALVYWGGKAIGGFFFTLVLLGLFYLFARRRLRFWPTLLIAFISSVVWQLIGVVGSAFIQFAGSRVLIYGALAWVTLVLVYMRVLAEILLFSSLLVSRATPPEEEA
ncbi:YihY/virulence factor BrkB family protein [bacterium]|nr:YihY/virulence factor BrkB family protein [bacterium]